MALRADRISVMRRNTTRSDAGGAKACGPEPPRPVGTAEAPSGPDGVSSRDARAARRAARGAPPRAALLAALLLAAVLSFAFARPAAATEGVLTIQSTEAAPSITELQRAAREARAEMKHLRARLARLSTQYEAARARLDALNAELVQTRLELSRAETTLEAQRALVGERLAAMYKSGTPSVLEVVAGFRGFSELESTLSLLKRVAENDEAEEAKLELMTRSAKRLASEIERQRSQALDIESEIDDRRAAVAATLEQRRALLEDLTVQLQQALAAGLPPSLLKAPPGGHTPVTWAKALLRALGMPQTTDNMAAIIAWEMAEGGHWYNSAHYNPLNTTWRMPGATAMNSVGVKAYVSWTQGLAATVETLHNGLYEGILSALRAGNDAQTVADAVASSPWGTGSFDVASLTG